MLTEIEKFRGFSNLGVPDKGLDMLKTKLKSGIRLKSFFTETLRKTPANSSEDNYSHFKKILNNMQEKIGDTLNADDRDSFRNDCKVLQTYAAIAVIKGKLKKHSKNKATCQEKFKEVINSPELGVVERAEIFDYFKDSIRLNRHKNPRLDDFFGIRNTTSWRATWKEIRDNAKQKLFEEVDALPETEMKKKRLHWAEAQPLFCDHRNNTVLKGAFGRTQAVRDIDAKIQMLSSKNV